MWRRRNGTRLPWIVLSTDRRERLDTAMGLVIDRFLPALKEILAKSRPAGRVSSWGSEVRGNLGRETFHQFDLRLGFQGREVRPGDELDGYTCAIA